MGLIVPVCPFVTQLYVAVEPRTESDFLYQRVPAELRPLVTVELKPSTDSAEPLLTDWDIVLGVTTF